MQSYSRGYLLRGLEKSVGAQIRRIGEILPRRGATPSVVV
jgi:hypothetical protein